MLEQTRADWTCLGVADPLWAVLVAPERKKGGWDTESFFATGRAEVDGALRQLAEFGVDHGRGCALDFGCGVGRLSQALAAYFAEVIGVDIAETMLEHARAFDQSSGRCRFVLNTEPNLAQVPDASVDLVFSSIVLQHVPPGPAMAYLREFTRIVRPGGAIVVLVPTGFRPNLKGTLARVLPQPLLRWAQRHVLGYPAPMRMHVFATRAMTELFNTQGMTLAGVTDEPEYSPHWKFTRFYAFKRS